MTTIDPVGSANAQGANDTLRVETLDGNDDVTVAPAVELLITPVIDLGVQ